MNLVPGTLYRFKTFVCLHMCEEDAAPCNCASLLPTNTCFVFVGEVNSASVHIPWDALGLRVACSRGVGWVVVREESFEPL